MCGKLRAVEKSPNALTLRNARRTLLGGMLSPLRDLAEPDLVRRGILVHCHRELGHRAGTNRAHIVTTQLCHGIGNSFVEPVGVHIDAMEDAFEIGKGDSAAGTSHGFKYT
jgi:hypothetical protein